MTELLQMALAVATMDSTLPPGQEGEGVGMRAGLQAAFGKCSRETRSEFEGLLRCNSLATNPTPNSAARSLQHEWTKQRHDTRPAPSPDTDLSRLQGGDIHDAECSSLHPPPPTILLPDDGSAVGAGCTGEYARPATPRP